MNSKRKGKVGEREFAALLREQGFDAKRGQQFAGGADSPDVKSEALAWLHIEVKRTQALNLADACAQAEGDCGRGAPAGHKKPWIVAHRRNHAPWLITMRAELFFDLVREFQPRTEKPASANDEGQLTLALSPLAEAHLMRPAATFSPSDAEKGIEAERESNLGRGGSPSRAGQDPNVGNNKHQPNQ